MLSFITLSPKDWQKHSYVTLCGVAEHALLQLLEENPQVKKISLCLDNDKAGFKARERLTDILAEKGYGEVFSLLPRQKDWNEDIQIQKTTFTQMPAVEQAIQMN